MSVCGCVEKLTLFVRAITPKLLKKWAEIFRIYSCKYIDVQLLHSVFDKCSQIAEFKFIGITASQPLNGLKKKQDSMFKCVKFTFKDVIHFKQQTHKNFESENSHPGIKLIYSKRTLNKFI